jgi:signal transduction histidine kinase
MDGLLDSLLLITRIEGTMSLDKQDEDVVKSLRTVLKQLATEFDDKNIKVDQNIPENLVQKIHKQ